MLDNENNEVVPVEVAQPTSVQIPENELDEQNEILYVRNTRMAINRQLMSDGKVPDDPEKLDFLLKNLKDMDNSAIARKRIKAEEKSTDSANAGMLALATQTLLAMRGGKILPPVEVVDIVEASNNIPQLPVELETTNFVPGEMQIGTVSEDVDAFRRRMNAAYERDHKD